MGRIQETFSVLATESRKALITYIVAGDPNKNITLSSMHLMVEKGVDIIELGVPFSDPMAEGPAIQRGHERSLLNATSMNDILEMVAKFRKNDLKTPIVLMGYCNPFMAMGVDRFFQLASQVGVDGIIVVDMPPEESKKFTSKAKDYQIDIIRLIAPTTSPERAKKILQSASGYVYYVSLNGVTGSNRIDISDVDNKLKSLNKVTNLPVVVGFGIKDKETVKAAAKFSSGVVVGSVLVDIMGSSNDESNIKDLLSEKLEELISGLRD